MAGSGGVVRKPTERRRGRARGDRGVSLGGRQGLGERIAALAARVARLETGRPPPGDGRAHVERAARTVRRCPGCGLPLRRLRDRCAECGRPLDSL